MLLVTIITIVLVLVASLWYFMQLVEPKKPLQSLQQKHAPKLPPGPRPLPILGSVLLLGTQPHRSLQQLAKKYGPIMHFKLISQHVIVVSSPKMVELFYKTHDAVCAFRPVTQSAYMLSYGLQGIIFAPYGSYWRNTKKLCMTELFNASKIQSFAEMRKEEQGFLVKSLRKAASAHEAVDVGSTVGGILEEMIYRMIYGTSKDDSLDLKTLVDQVVSVEGTLNIADYLPFLAPLDLQGMKKRLTNMRNAVDEIFEKIIKQREQQMKSNGGSSRAFIDILLSLMHKSSTPKNDSSSIHVLGKSNIKALLVDLIGAGIETSANTITWAFSALLKHPHTMKKLQEEITGIVGMDRMVDETDLSKFTYLDMVMKETFRLYAFVFFPHVAMDELTAGDYRIPKGSKVYINAWAMGRDPEIWSDDCEQFRPERFIDNNVDIGGQDFRLLPFGSGRRRCTGMQLGLINTKLVLAQLVHCFDWGLPNGMHPSELDMQEKFGITTSRANNLIALPSYRLLSA